MSILNISLIDSSYKPKNVLNNWIDVDDRDMGGWCMSKYIFFFLSIEEKKNVEIRDILYN